MENVVYRAKIPFSILYSKDHLFYLSIGLLNKSVEGLEGILQHDLHCRYLRSEVS